MGIIFVQSGYVIDFAIPVRVEVDASGKLVITCPNAIIFGTAGKDVDLQWRMETADYEIEGIEFEIDKGKTDEKDKEFRFLDKTATKGYKSTNKMKKGSYKYEIKVKKISDPTITSTLDPMIKNEPQ